MSIQRRWEVRRPDLLREGWSLFLLVGENAPVDRTYRALQPNGVVFDEYAASNITEAWDSLIAELDAPPKRRTACS